MDEYEIYLESVDEQDNEYSHKTLEFNEWEE